MWVFHSFLYFSRTGLPWLKLPHTYMLTIHLHPSSLERSSANTVLRTVANLLSMDSSVPRTCQAQPVFPLSRVTTWRLSGGQAPHSQVLPWQMSRNRYFLSFTPGVYLLRWKNKSSHGDWTLVKCRRLGNFGYWRMKLVSAHFLALQPWYIT